jgi:hypothetical protein
MSHGTKRSVPRDSFGNCGIFRILENELEDNQLWATVWKCGASAVGVIAIAIAGCTAHQNFVQTEALEKAQNPAALQCSFGDRDEKASAFCVEVAKGGK